MSERRINDAEMEELIEYLQGSCNTLDDGLEALFNGEVAELSEEGHAILDERIFNCTECGWWCAQEENAAEEGEEWICKDCAEG